MVSSFYPTISLSSICWLFIFIRYWNCVILAINTAGPSSVPGRSFGIIFGLWSKSCSSGTLNTSCVMWPIRLKSERPKYLHKLWPYLNPPLYIPTIKRMTPNYCLTQYNPTKLASLKGRNCVSDLKILTINTMTTIFSANSPFWSVHPESLPTDDPIWQFVNFMFLFSKFFFPRKAMESTWTAGQG